MTARPTAEIVADLRDLVTQSKLPREAADRLAELEAERSGCRKLHDTLGKVGRYRYLCTSGHHVCSNDTDLTICPARPVIGWIGKYGDANYAPDYGDPCGVELRHYGDCPAWELDDFDALRLPCPTCGGTRTIRKQQSDGVRTDFGCPDCTDGRLAHERAWKIVAAVFDDEWLQYDDGSTASDLRRHLLGIR